jgi:transposase
MVCVDKMRVTDASKTLGINYQTAKSILRRYHLTGEISRKYRIGQPLNTTNQQQLMEYLKSIDSDTLRESQFNQP